MTIYKVGQNRAFTTIAQALFAASSGDTIFIDEGIYYENIYLDNKIVNLVGVYDYPSEHKVKIIGSNQYGTIRTKWDNTSEIELLIEGIRIESVLDTAFSLIWFYQYSAATSGLKVTFSKCSLSSLNATTSNHYMFSGATNSSLGVVKSLVLKNCECLMHNSHLTDNYFSAIPTCVMEKCILNSVPNLITPHAFNNPYYDYILTNQSYPGYGPVYANFLADLPHKTCFSGTINENNVPVNRELRFFRGDNDVYLGSTVSSGVSGDYYFESTFSGYHYIICLDDLSSPHFNDLIKAKCLPLSLPEDTYTFKNLTVINADAETGDLTGWVEEVGTFDVTTTSFGGTYAFHDVGQVDPALLYQRIDLSSDGISFSVIDTGNCNVLLGGMVRTGYSDVGWFGIRFLDSTQTILGTEVFGPTFADFTSWRPEFVIASVVSGTRYVDLLLKTHEIGGGYTDVQFDDIYCTFRFPV